VALCFVVVLWTRLRFLKGHGSMSVDCSVGLSIAGFCL